MRNERLLHAFGQIDEKFIEEANPETMRANKKREARRMWVKWGSMAACLVLVLGGALAAAMNGQKFKAVDELNSIPNRELGSCGKPVDGTVSGTDVVTTEKDAAMEEAQDTIKAEVDSKGENPAEDESAEDAAAERAEWGITLSAKDVTPIGLTLVIRQSGGAPTGRLQYGSDYHLQVLKEGVWVDVPYAVEGDVGWTSEAYLVTMEDSVESELNWEWLYGSLEAGTYRISKGFMDFRGTGDYDNRSFYTEFEVE